MFTRRLVYPCNENTRGMRRLGESLPFASATAEFDAVRMVIRVTAFFHPMWLHR